MSRTKCYYTVCVFPPNEGRDSHQLDNSLVRGRDQVKPAITRLKLLWPEGCIVVRQHYWDRMHNRWGYRVMHNLLDTYRKEATL